MTEFLDPGVRARLGANARRAVEPMTPEAMTLELVLLYRELLAASAARRKGASAAPPPGAAPGAPERASPSAPDA